MNDEQMHDLKNFLSTEISRQIHSDLRAVIRDEVSAQLSGQSEGIMREFAELKTDVAELKTDVAELKTDVAELKTDVAELKTDVKYLKAHAAETDEKLDAIMQAVGESFEDQHGQIANHELRLTRIETATP